MENQVADIGLPGTSPGYRRRGYAKKVISALIERFMHRAGKVRHATSPDNHASMATVCSVGFVPYARSLYLSAPAGDLAAGENGDS